MSQKILTSALLLAPAILLASCGNNEQKAAPTPINATPEVKKVDVAPTNTESMTTGTVSPTDTQTGTSSMQTPSTEIDTAPIMAMRENKSSEDESESEDESNDDSISKNESTNPSVTPPSSPKNQIPTNQQPVIIAGASVTKEVHYTSPAGDETVEFTMTTSGDTITAISAKPLASNPISTMMQTKFSESIQSKVVGKKKSELQLDAVGGASLTTNAFKKFVAQN
ncbi:hypothetical protein KC711_02445 [Candidatus Peregrinibacteria bacterium]|nr:hypothetical protein [Candidatus Peregrinibacteria bacterium]